MSLTHFVIPQQRNAPASAFIGRILRLNERSAQALADLPTSFIYFDSSGPGGGVYFACGKLKLPAIPAGDGSKDHLVEVFDYKPFIEPVSFADVAGTPRETLASTSEAAKVIREVSRQVFDEICLDGKVQLHFRADAHLIKVLGEQLIASEKVGVLELIKNAYDAGASYCRVWIENIPSLPE